MAGGFWLGVQQGTEKGLAQRIASMEREQTKLAASRRYKNEQLVQQDQFNRTLAERVATREADTSHKTAVLSQADEHFIETHELNRDEYIADRNEFNKSYVESKRQFDESIGQRKTEAGDTKDYRNRTLALAGNRAREDNRRFTMTHDLTKSGEREAARRFDVTHELAKSGQEALDDRFDKRVEADKDLLATRLNQDADQFQKRQALEYKKLEELKNYHQGMAGTKPKLGNLDSTIAKSVRDMGAKAAKTFTQLRGENVSGWFDPQLTPIQQIKAMEKFGETAIAQIMPQVGYDKVAAIRYLPQFYTGMMTDAGSGDGKGKNKGFGDAVRELINKAAGSSTLSRLDWENNIYDAMERGALQALGVKLNSGQDRAPATMDMRQNHPEGFFGTVRDWGQFWVDPVGAGKKVGYNQINKILDLGVASNWSAERIMQEGKKKGYKPKPFIEEMIKRGILKVVHKDGKRFLTDPRIPNQQ